ncbi:hypothetical protein Adt_09798 [Abeliophyllum distichum]|uniref:Uncharacterized protein n=1 Tax=Abeliophyllum distichum TaxID=126358 RepID=A0ABD1UI69_9LAMI
MADQFTNLDLLQFLRGGYGSGRSAPTPPSPPTITKSLLNLDKAMHNTGCRALANAVTTWNVKIFSNLVNAQHQTHILWSPTQPKQLKSGTSQAPLVHSSIRG